MKLTPEEIDSLTADPAKVYLPMPTLEELDEAIWLLHKRYTIDCIMTRRYLKKLVKRMNKHYDMEWTVPASWNKR